MNLILKNIKHYEFRYIFTFVIVMLMNVFIFASSILISGTETGISVSKNKIGADLIVSAKTDDFDIIAENIMYEGTPNTLYVDKKYEDRIKTMPHVTDVTSRMYLATLEGMSCCDDKVQLIATDLSTDFLLSSWVKSEKLEKGEIIVGYKFGADKGDTVKYYGKEFTVKEKLEKTGSGYDLSGFISYESAYEIISDKTYEELFKDVTRDTTSIIFVNSDNIEVTKNIIESNFYNELSVYSLNDKFENFIKTVGIIKKIVNIINIFLILISSLSVFTIAAIATNNRKNEFGSLLLIGKNKLYIAKTFICEQLLVCLFAGVISVISILVIKLLFTNYLELFITTAIINDTKNIIFTGLFLIGLNVIIAVGSVLLSIINLCKISPSELIKESC